MKYKNKADQILYDAMIKAAVKHDNAIDKALDRCIRVVDKVAEEFREAIARAKKVYEEANNE